MTGIPGTAYRNPGEPFEKSDCPGECWCMTCLRERKLVEEIARLNAVIERSEWTDRLLAMRRETARLRGLIEQAEWQGGDGNTHEVTRCCPWCRAWAEQPDGHDPNCPAFPPVEAKT
jgi:hypothetical protein